ncbi:MAG: GBS Bsp-like repeat-containing protein, partial [Solibacillus sp.]
TGSSPAITALSYSVTSNRSGVTYWYPAVKNAEAKTWECTVPLSDFTANGEYSVSSYGVIRGAAVYLGSASLTAKDPSATIAIENKDVGAGTFDAVSKVSSLSGVKALSFAVWDEATSTTSWYAATQQGDAFRATIDIAYHGFSTGTYTVQAYIVDGNGVLSSPASARATTDVGTPEASITAVLAADQKTAKLTTGSSPAITALSYSVTSNRSGVTYWYPAVKNAEAKTWECTVPLSDFTANGEYSVSSYGVIRGAAVYLGSASLTAKDPSATIAIENKDVGAGTFDAVSKVSSLSGVKALSFAVWDEATSTTSWYAATQQGDAFRATIDIAYHGFSTGTYTVQAYIVDGNGVLSSPASARATTDIGITAIMGSREVSILSLVELFNSKA